VVGVSEVLRFTVEYEPPDETGAIVARVREVPSALSYGRTREEARANVLDALKLMLSPEPGTSDEDTLDVPLAS
jgi:predicted RNase H-like HicB family nuclease